MTNALLELALFSAKALIIVLLILLILITFAALLSRGKQKLKGRFHLQHLNKKFDETSELILSETLSKKKFKKYLKERKNHEKARHKEDKAVKQIYVVQFHGDMRASAVECLREEITAILNVATKDDEVVVKLDSAGGVVHGYGLAAAQLMRLRAAEIPLTVTIDKVAASGGYLMACVANKIIAAPFAIIGSIGVIVQLPNFHRLLEEKHVDFEQFTAGEFKRTVTIFGKNTEEGKRKLQEEIEDVHQLFKNLITTYRSNVDFAKVATGEYWLGQQAIALNLIDTIQTSDDYLQQSCKEAEVFELTYEIKKPLLNRFAGHTNTLFKNAFTKLLPTTPHQ